MSSDPLQVSSNYGTGAKISLVQEVTFYMGLYREHIQNHLV